MTKPTIHLNGTSPSDLANQYLEAYRAVNDAIEKLSEASPNGRDYYPQGDTALSSAVKEHTNRMLSLRSVASDMLALCEHCQDAADERERRRNNSNAIPV